MLLLINLFGVCMQLYEIILAAMGIVLFIAAIVFTGLKRDTKLLITMYLASLVMIAFPAISKVAFSEITVEVQRLQCINNRLADNPSDTTLQEAAKKKIEDIKRDGLDSTNTSTVITIANTNALLKDSVKAVEWVEKGLRSNINSKQLIKLKEKLNTPRVQIEVDLQKIKNNPANKETLRQLNIKTKALEKTIAPSADVLTTLSKANAILGDSIKATQQVDAALRVNPKNAEAIKVKRNLFVKPN